MTVDVSQTGYQFELDAILAVVIGGTSLAGGKFSLAGAAIGAVLIATLDKTVVFLGVPASATPGVQGGRHHRPLRRAVRPLPRRWVAEVATTAAELRAARWWRHERAETHRAHRADRLGAEPATLPGRAVASSATCARHRDATSTGAALAIFLAMLIYGQITYGAHPPAQHASRTC